MKIDHTWASAT